MGSPSSYLQPHENSHHSSSHRQCTCTGWVITSAARTMKWKSFDSLRRRLNRRPFADDIFKWIFLNENVWILINISLKFVPRGPINNIPTLVQVMACRRPGDKPLFEPMMVSLPTHICVTRPQWVNHPDKRPPFHRRYFQTHFREWQVLYFV